VTVYVRAGHERHGLGRALSLRVLEILEKQGYRAIVAVIALPNDPSVALHESLGFELAGTLKSLGFKLGEWHDVTFWQRNSGDPAEPPGEIKPVSEVVHA
jgi:phosphinothricin acetyltransferase